MIVTQFLAGISRFRAALRHRLAVGAAALAAGQYAAATLNFVTSVLMARLLGPTEYGLVALTVAYPTLIWSFVGVKSVSVLTRYVAGLRVKGENERLKAVVKLGYGLDFLISCIAFILVVGSGWWVSRHFYQRPDIAWLMVIYAASFPLFSLTGTSQAVLSSWERFKWLAVLEVLHPFTKLMLVTVFLLAGFGAAGAVIGTALAQAGIGLIMMVIATELLRREKVGLWWTALLYEAAPLRKELTAFFGWNYLMVTLSGVVGQVPLMMLGKLRGPEEAGYYRLATSLVTVGSYLEGSLGRVAYPVLSARWGAGERETLRRSLRRWTLKAGLPVALLLVATIPLLPIFVPMILGSGFRPMVLGTQIMFLGSAVSAMFFWLTAFYYSSGKVSTWVVGYGLYTVVVVGLGWLLIKLGGFVGISGLMAISKVLFTLAMLVPLRKMDAGAEF